MENDKAETYTIGDQKSKLLAMYDLRQMNKSSTSRIGPTFNSPLASASYFYQSRHSSNLNKKVTSGDFRVKSTLQNTQMSRYQRP